MSDSPSPTTFIAPDFTELAPLFPGFEIEGLIATGGMGAVYYAVQKSLDRAVAIKILPPELSADAAFRVGFEAEAKAMARLNHANLIGVYDFGEVAGMLYIIMEFVPGKSLFHSSHGIAIDPSEVVRIVCGICSGLAHAHDNGIIHRDIKPANILLDLHANPKIGDFGLARPSDRQFQEGEEIFGTPHYTAPEVVNAPHTVDHRADIFSLGVILHELLTGRLPADDTRPASVIARCDVRFDAIIRRATDPVAAKRYSSAHEIERDLRRITGGPKASAAKTRQKAPPRPTLARPSVKKSSGNPAFKFLMFAAVIAAAVYFLLPYKDQLLGLKPSSLGPAPQQAAPAPADPTADQPAQPIEESPSVNPSETEPQPTAVDRPLPKQITPSVIADIKAMPKIESASKAQPKYDVSAFFERARKIMHDRTAHLIDSRNSSLKENVSRFERDAKRHIHKIQSAEKRTQAEEALADLIKDCVQDQYDLPYALPEKLSRVEGVQDAFDERNNIEKSIDTNLKRSLAQSSATYILGLEKQIERLQAEDDPGAIEAIREEVKQTRTDEDYFPNLMLGFK